MKKAAFIFIILVIVFGVIFVFTKINKSENENPQQNNDKVIVNSFDSCVSAGYPVQESYPRRCILPDGTAFTEEVEEENYEIILNSPKPNEVLSSPINIEGEAVGQWFFEANFSAELVDSSGKVIGTSVLTAEDDWMTEELVPFGGKLEYENSSGQAELILKSANPSGLPENQKIFSIPVRLE